MTTHERTATRAALPALPNRDERAVTLRIDEYGNDRDVLVERHDAYPVTYRDALVERVAALLPDASAATLDAATDTLAALFTDGLDALDGLAARLDMLGVRTVDVLDALDRLRFDPLDDDGSAARPVPVARRKADAAVWATRRVVGSSLPWVESWAAWTTGAPSHEMAATVEQIDEMTRWYYGSSIPAMIGTDVRSWEEIGECADPVRLRERMGRSIDGSWDARKRRPMPGTRLVTRSPRIMPKPRKTAGREIVEQDVERDGVTFLASRVEILAPGPVVVREGVEYPTTRRVARTFRFDGQSWHASESEPRARRVRRARDASTPRRARVVPVLVESVETAPLDDEMTARLVERTRVVRLGDAIRTAGTPEPATRARVVESSSDVARGAWTDGRVTVSVADIPKSDRWRLTITVRDADGNIERRGTRSNVRRGGIGRAVRHYLARG